MENVSVIIATHNDGRYIGDCLASVVAAKAAEIIVVDDASEDDTLARLQALNSGPSVARNKGMAAASYRYCATVDADDVIPPERLQVMSDLARRLDACAVVDELVAFDSQTGAKMWAKLARMRIIAEHKQLTVSEVIKYDLGVLKPLLDLDKLRRIAVTYPQDIRRGEDFIFLLEILHRRETLFATPATRYMLRRRTLQRQTSDRPRLYAALLRNELSYHARRRWSLPQHLHFLRRHLRNTLALGKNIAQSVLKPRP